MAPTIRDPTPKRTEARIIENGSGVVLNTVAPMTPGGPKFPIATKNH